MTKIPTLPATLLGALVLASGASGIALACTGANPAIVSAGASAPIRDGAHNRFSVKVTVTNKGTAGQPSNLLQTVDIVQDQTKVGAKGVPPLKPGQSYSFTYSFVRAFSAAPGTTHLIFRLHVDQPSGSSQDCNLADDRYRLNV
jgi:hypothetical protein